jgi:hypothetical protein
MVRKYLGAGAGLAGVYVLWDVTILFHSKYFGEIGLKPSAESCI